MTRQIRSAINPTAETLSFVLAGAQIFASVFNPDREQMFGSALPRIKDVTHGPAGARSLTRQEV